MSGSDPDYMNIRFETLQQAGDDLAAALSAVHATLDTLDSDLKATLGQWTGDAWTEYYAKQAKWNATMGRMQGALNALTKHIVTVGEAYQAVENQNTSMWHS